MAEDRGRAYWRANVRLMLGLLAVWFVVSFVCGILAVDWLNQFRFFGYKLGFWFAQQGAIGFFVLLIFVYAWRMNVLDRRFGVDERDGQAAMVGAEAGGQDRQGATPEASAQAAQPQQEPP